MNTLDYDQQKLCSRAPIRNNRSQKIKVAPGMMKTPASNNKINPQGIQRHYIRMQSKRKINKAVNKNLKQSCDLRINSNIDFNVGNIVVQNQQNKTILKRQSLRILKKSQNLHPYQTLSAIKKIKPQHTKLSGTNQLDLIKTIMQHYDNNMTKTKILHPIQEQRKRNNYHHFITQTNDPQTIVYSDFIPTQRHQKFIINMLKTQKLVNSAFNQKQIQLQSKSQEYQKIIPLNNQRIKKIVQQSFSHPRYQADFPSMITREFKYKLSSNSKFKQGRKLTNYL